jgi:hypothetical protein
MRNVMRALALLGTAAAVMTATANAQTAAPITRSAPTIQGTPIVGKTLTATNGLWSNNPTSFSYQWLRCDDNGNNCVNRNGATDKTYTLKDGDIGHTIVVLVTAKNSAGSSTANSKPTDVVTPAVPPKSKVAPSITGKPFVGEQLVADPGEYTGGAVAKFSYQWQRCDATGTKCTDITGATGQTYGVLKADVGHPIRVQVTATNDFGSTSSLSKPTAAIQVAATPPVKVTTEISASRDLTVCCQTSTLSGTVSTHKAGERITILARQADDITSYPLMTTTTDSLGNWSVRVQPMIATTYIAQTSNTKSDPLTIRVHPRLGLGVSGNNFSAKITARDSFAGAVALFQVLRGRSWHTVQLVVTNIHSVARFHVNLRRGHTYNVRIYLPQRQAGFGYLDGVSHVRRVGGTA